LVIALGAGALALPLCPYAQPAKVVRIGYLGATSATGYAKEVAALRAGLHELGYIEGKNLFIEFRWSEGRNERLSELAAELVRLKVDVIVTHQHSGTRAAKQATATIPIVIAVVGDAVASGLVSSLARPGGNITGSSFFSQELSAKRLELLKEIFPRIRRVALLWNAGGAGVSLPAMEAAAASLKLNLRQFGVRGPDEFEAAFAEMARQRVEAVAIAEDPMLVANAGVAAGLAMKQRIPAIGFIEVADAGGLLTYGVNFPAMFHRAAYFVDRILKGANPGELPIERATTFDLVVNMKTAKALGINIPQSILVRADRVIE
jgi:putative ABC transport system substrate-binding protein